MDVLVLVLLVIALICFLAALLNATIERVNLVALGGLLTVLALLIPRIH